MPPKIPYNETQFMYETGMYGYPDENISGLAPAITGLALTKSPGQTVTTSFRVTNVGNVPIRIWVRANHKDAAGTFWPAVTGAETTLAVGAYKDYSQSQTITTAWSTGVYSTLAEVFDYTGAVIGALLHGFELPATFEITIIYEARITLLTVT